MTDLTDTPAGLKMGEASDLASLIKEVKAKNRDAFEALYDATVQRVFSLAMRITQHRGLAEEVVSDVYLQVWQTAASYSPERGKVIAWLSILCRSRALDTLRRDNTAIRQMAVGLDTIPEPEDVCDPSDLLQSIEENTAIHAAVGQLTERQRQLVAQVYSNL